MEATVRGAYGYRYNVVLVVDAITDREADA